MSTFFGKYAPNTTGGGAGGGSVTEVDTGTGLNGGPITTTGTIALDVPVTVAHGGTGQTALGNLTDAGTDGIVVTGGTGAVVTSVSLAQHVADASHNGYLSQTDWSTFNAKEPAVTKGNLTDVGTDGITVTGGTGAVIGSGTSLAQHVADSTHNGYLSSTDWSTFNAKEPAVTKGNLTDAGTDGIVVTGGTGAVIGSGTSIAQHVADSTHNGYLSQTDWSTFNGKQASGNYITDLTGDVTASGPGSAASTVAKIQTKTVSGTTGTVNVVFSTSPTLVTPAIGTPSSGILSSCTGLSLTSGVTGVLPLANGGTNKNMTAAAGGIVWTDADSMEVTAAGTSQQWVLSGGTSAPTMSDTTTTAKMIDGSADAIQLTVQGHSTQTSDVFVVEKSDGTDLVTVTNVNGTAIRGDTTSGTASAGFVGEQIAATITADTTTATSDTEIDVTGASIALTPGQWLVCYAVPLALVNATGSPVSIFGRIRTTTSGNSYIGGSASIAGLNSVVASGTFATNVSRSFVVNLSANTTYKLRVTCNRSSATGTATVWGADAGIFTGTDNEAIFYATRMR